MFRRILALSIALTLLFVAWAVAAHFLAPEDPGVVVLLPGPMDVLRALGTLLFEEGFFLDILHSILRISLGILAAAIPASLLSLYLGTHPRSFEIVDPIFSFMKYLPPVALIPILMLWLGIGLQQQVAFLFIGTFFALTIELAEIVSTVPKEYQSAALTLGTARSKMMLRVTIPYCLPEFIERLRGVVALAWTYLIVAEMIGVENGIGEMIIIAQRAIRTDEVLAGLLVIGLLGILFDKSLQLLSFLICGWKRV